MAGRGIETREKNQEIRVKILESRVKNQDYTKSKAH
jgi:hypothetical protein